MSAVARFIYFAYVFVQAGESLNSVPLELLLIDVMEIHRFALYGAGGGAILGIILVLVDLLRYGGHAEWRPAIATRRNIPRKIKTATPK